MTRPIPLAILSFLFGVLLVAMIVAPHFYTIEDAVFRNPDYAGEILVEAKVVANSELWPQLATSADEGATTLAPHGDSAEPSEPSTILADTAATGMSLVIRLQNSGDATAWGKLNCRIIGTNAPIPVPVEFLTANMAKPVLCVIPLDGVVEPEGGWQVKTRWAKLYTK